MCNLNRGSILNHLRKPIALTCCTRNWRCDSNGDLKGGSNHKSRELDLGFELDKTVL